MGIYHSLSFLIEGMNGETVEANIRERTRQQLETIKSFLAFFGDHAPEVKALVQAARADLTGESISEEVSLVMDYVPDPGNPTVSVGVIEIESGQKGTRVIEAFHPLVESQLSITRPVGYAIPGDLAQVISALERHGIDFTRLEAPRPASLESYRILSVTETEKEDKDFLEVTVDVESRVEMMPEGTVIVLCDQLASNLIPILLEPQSQWGLAPLPDFVGMLTVGADYPIKRILPGPEPG
jgi:hypothetical protein